jgi:hypothetical protein
MVGMAGDMDAYMGDYVSGCIPTMGGGYMNSMGLW